MIPVPLVGEDANSISKFRWWALATHGGIPGVRDVETVPGIAAGVTARLGAVIRGEFAFLKPGTNVVATALPEIAAGLREIQESGVRGDALAESTLPMPGVFERYDVVWWEPVEGTTAAFEKGSYSIIGRYRVHRDTGLKLFEPMHFLQIAALYGQGAKRTAFLDSFPTSGHHALVDPRVVPTPNRKAAMDHDTFWSAPFWLGHVGSTGSSLYDTEFAALRTCAMRYAAPVVRTCNACYRRTSSDVDTGVHAPLQACARCRAVYYCCRECQVHDWKGCGHKEKCPGLAAAVAARAASATSRLPMHRVR